MLLHNHHEAVLCERQLLRHVVLRAHAHAEAGRTRSIRAAELVAAISLFAAAMLRRKLNLFVLSHTTLCGFTMPRSPSKPRSRRRLPGCWARRTRSFWTPLFAGAFCPVSQWSAQLLTWVPDVRVSLHANALRRNSCRVPVNVTWMGDETFLDAAHYLRRCA